MTNRIFRSIFSVSAVILGVTLCLMIGIWFNLYGEQLEKELKKEAGYLAIAVEENGIESLEKLPKNSERVTLINSDGTVLFDNEADVATMENHLDREEIQEAVKAGQGKAVRKSATLEKDTVYYALRLSGGEILRISSTQYSIPGILGGLFRPLLVLIAGMLLLSFAVSFRISKKVVEPLNELNLNNPEQNETYDEIAPLLTKINRQQKVITQQLNDAKRQQEEFAVITDNMSEGLLVIDSHTELLSCNSSALKMLGLKKASTEQSVLALNRSEPFRKSVEQVLKGEHVAEIVEVEGGIRQLIANPVVQEGKVNGGVLLLVDVTEKVQREKLRREFTANVSHELKTPLTSISGYAEIMQNGFVKEEDVKRVSRKIYDEAQRLIILVGDIMEISRLDEGNITYQAEQVNLKEKAEEIIERLCEEARKKEVKMELTGEPVTCMAISSILDKVLYNLIDNAIKYNRQQGKVTVNVFKEKEHYGISVTDTGIGIPKIHQEHIFERFYRIDKSRSKEIGGTGLGLSIVKHGAVCLGAEILVESIPEQGSTFTLRW